MPFESDKAPHLLTIEELGAMLRLTKASARSFAWRELVKLGGVIKVGARLMVHTWAVNRWLESNKISPEHDRVVRAKATHEKRLARARARYHSGESGVKTNSGLPFKGWKKATDETVVEVPD